MAPNASGRRKPKVEKLPKNLGEIVLKALDYSSEGIILGSLDGTVYYHNKAWLRIHALDENLNLRGKNVRDYERPELIPILDRFVGQMLKQGSADYQFGTVRRDGMYHDVYLTGNIIREVDPPIAVVILREVTDLVQTQREIARRNVELAVLNEMHNVMTHTRNMKVIIRKIMRLLGDFVGAKSCGFYIVDRARKEFVLVDSMGLAPRVKKRVATIPMEGDDLAFAKIARSRHTSVLEEDMPGHEGGESDIRKSMGIKRTIATVFKTGTKRDYMTIFGLPSANKVDPDVRAFFDTAAKQFGVAIERIELLEALERRRRELHALTVRLIDAAEEEKRRCSLMLHDEIGQSLTALKLEIEMLEKRLDPLDSCTRKSFDCMRKQITFVANSTRAIAKSFHPAMLEELGFVPTLNWYIDNFVRGEGLEVTFEAAGFNEDLPAQMALALYRVAQEALTNVVRHAEASRVAISLTKGYPYAIMEIEDNGRGIPKRTNKSKRRGLGLVSMRERVEYMGGTFRVSSSPGKGTKVRVKLPIKAEHD